MMMLNVYVLFVKLVHAYVYHTFMVLCLFACNIAYMQTNKIINIVRRVLS